MKVTIQSFYSYSLVCRAWYSTSQKYLFSWIILLNNAQLDKLFHVLHPPNSSSFRLLGYIRRISMRYSPPYSKFGQALPRIATLRPPNLERLDFYGEEFADFPFHPSLPAFLSCLDQVRELHISNLQFKHFMELRRFVSGFRGIRSVVFLGHPNDGLPQDKLGEYRPILSCARAGRPSLVACESSDRSLLGFPLSFWLSSHARVPNSPKNHGSAPVVVAPTLSRDLVEFLAALHPVALSRWSSISEVWQWKSETDSGNVKCS